MEERNERGETLQEFLDQYDENRYRRGSNTVDMILFTELNGKLKVLLVKRKDHPFIHDWAMPGGFVNFDEDLDTAVKRELEEETNLSDSTYFRQLYTFGNADRDPRTRVITTVYLSMTSSENIKRTSAGDDAMDTGWFTVQKVTSSTDGHQRNSILMLDDEAKDIHICYEIIDRAKDNYVQTRSKLLESSNAKLAADHIKAINMAIDVVRNRAASTGIMFNLLPKECTLRHIQKVYEAIVNHPVDTANFRRDIKKMLVPTGKTTLVNGRRVSTYTFNPLLPFIKETL
ncbi:MAG: NUDIX hydrolase [Erysipelotrichaceae bacterium]|nr:NUDIX hydrolase [Erysipelotrichaceae bacterium]MDY6034503.1 NUDIX hydrolase [Bulleidia sp.]